MQSRTGAARWPRLFRPGGLIAAIPIVQITTFSTTSSINLR
jgi:hypothetical protein